MKTSVSTLRLVIATALFGALASIASAGAGVQHWQTLRQSDQFSALKAGDKVAYVCTTCSSVNEVALASADQAAALHKDGAAYACPSCKKTVKIVVKKTRNDAPTHSEVVYVDDQGVERGFFAKVASAE